MISAARCPGGVEQVHRLEDRVPIGPVRRRADRARTHLVLDLEHRLARPHERVERRALVELLALLVDGEVEVGQQLRDLRRVVLETDREPLRVGEVRERRVEQELRRLGDR